MLLTPITILLWLLSSTTYNTKRAVFQLDVEINYVDFSFGLARLWDQCNWFGFRFTSQSIESRYMAVYTAYNTTYLHYLIALLTMLILHIYFTILTILILLLTLLAILRRPYVFPFRPSLSCLVWHFNCKLGILNY